MSPSLPFRPGLGAGVLWVLASLAACSKESTDSDDGCRVCEGDVYIVGDQDDHDRAADCREIEGKLWLDEEDWITDLSLPCLQTVGSQVNIDENPLLVSISLPELWFVDAWLFVQDNASLTMVDLPSLREVDASLDFADNDALKQLALPSLELVDNDLDITHHDSLEALSIPALESLEWDLHIQYNDALTQIDMSALKSIGSDFYLWDNDALNDLSGLSSLKTIGGALSIARNPCLDQAEAEAFAASIDVGSMVFVEDNGTAQPCD